MRSNQMEQYQIEAAMGRGNRSYLEVSISKFMGGKRKIGVYIYLYNSGLGAAHHPFFLAKKGSEMKIANYGAFKHTGIRGRTSAFQWIGTNIVIPSGCAMLMSELQFELQRKSTSLEYFVGAQGIEPIKNKVDFPEVLSLGDGIESDVPVLVNPAAKLS